MSNPAWRVATPRLTLAPVGWQDLDDLRRLKGDPGVYGQMLGGVRGPGQVAAELAEETAFWARRGVGMWMVREAGAAIGLVGFHDRPDGLGLALRFAFLPAARGRGLAREAAGAALRFAAAQGVGRVVAVARESNLASRTVLGAIGMRPCGEFWRNGVLLLMFESGGK